MKKEMQKQEKMQGYEKLMFRLGQIAGILLILIALGLVLVGYQDFLKELTKSK